VRARYENSVLKPLGSLELNDGEEALVRVERIVDKRRIIVEKLYKKRRPAPKELLVQSYITSIA
jgi:predicted DNA-binding antitoxin AbrB/MazE fold protein